MGQQVLIPPEWATHVSWSESSAELNRQQEQEQEQDFYHYYKRPNYWEREHQRDLLVTHN